MLPNETTPKITVLMPFYNCEKYIDQAVSSILNQSFQDFEFIIINDASTDQSDELVQKYLTDKRVIYIKNTNNKKNCIESKLWYQHRQIRYYCPNGWR
jgi:glycosyltransferase involved in cell wall biosynthesis